MILRREFFWTDCKFSKLPVEQSSITTTDLPSASSLSTRCEPIKPAPPVTRMCLPRFCSSLIYCQSAGGQAHSKQGLVHTRQRFGLRPSSAAFPSTHPELTDKVLAFRCKSAG